MNESVPAVEPVATIVEPGLPTTEPVAPSIPTTEVAGDTPSAEEVAVTDDAPPKPSGMLADLIAARVKAKTEKARADAAEQRLAAASPLLDRLTPDVQQAIAEGRLTIQPPQSNADLERTRLEQVAQDLGLLKADNTPDLDAARRVDKYVRGTVQAAVEPVRNLTLAERAHNNAQIAIQHAQTTGMDEEAIRIVQEEYQNILRMPNGAQMLSQPDVAKTVWRQAMGRLVEEGKYTGKTTPKAPAVAPANHPAVVVSDATGRRSGGASAIQLSPQLQSVYAAHGLDPAKTKAPKVDQRGHMELENR